MNVLERHIAKKKLAGKLKVAATLAQLRAGAQLVKREVPEDAVTHMFGALALPTKRQTRSPLGKKMEKFQQGVLGKRVSEHIAKELAPIVARKKPGTIIMHPQVGQLIDPTAGRKRVRALRDITALHESAERSAPLAMGSLHANPVVLAKDFNLLSRLSGPGSRGARRSFGSIREPEFALLRKQLVDRFGPRAAEFMQPGAKIPKAMRKIIEREGFPLSLFGTTTTRSFKRITKEQGKLLRNKMDKMPGW